VDSFIRLIGPEQAVELFGVRLVGINAENLTKLVFTLVFIAWVRLPGSFARWLSSRVLDGRDRVEARFWRVKQLSSAPQCS
jgi:hypothetical protein